MNSIKNRLITKLVHGYLRGEKISIQITGREFEGPYSDVNHLRDSSGIYAILDKRYDGYYLVDVGESSEVRTRISNHDRKSCWSSVKKGTLRVAVLYTPSLQQQGRKLIEQWIRNKLNPSCGSR